MRRPEPLQTAATRDAILTARNSHEQSRLLREWSREMRKRIAATRTYLREQRSDLPDIANRS